MSISWLSLGRQVALNDATFRQECEPYFKVLYGHPSSAAWSLTLLSRVTFMRGFNWLGKVITKPPGWTMLSKPYVASCFLDLDLIVNRRRWKRCNEMDFAVDWVHQSIASKTNGHFHPIFHPSPFPLKMDENSVMLKMYVRSNPSMCIFQHNYDVSLQDIRAHHCAILETVVRTISRLVCARKVESINNPKGKKNPTKTYTMTLNLWIDVLRYCTNI